MQEILYTKFFNNTLYDYLIVGAVILLAILIQRLAARFIGSIVFSFLHKRLPLAEKEYFYDLLLLPIQLLFLVLVSAIALKTLHYPPVIDIIFFGEPLHDIISLLYKTAFAVIITFALVRLVDFITLLLSIKIHATYTRADDQILLFAKEIVKLTLVVACVLFVVGRIFAVDISTAVAGAGIMALAVALAAKETLQNLMASVIIFLEQPFTIGDYVHIDNTRGIVQKVGFRSTLIRTPENVLVTIPNNKMVDSVTENIPLTALSKVSTSIRLQYNTNTTQIQNITHDIRQFIEDYADTDKQVNVGLDEFGTNALIINIRYFLLDQADAVKHKQIINFAIIEIVAKHKAAFAVS